MKFFSEIDFSTIFCIKGASISVGIYPRSLLAIISWIRSNAFLDKFDRIESAKTSNSAST